MSKDTARYGLILSCPEALRPAAVEALTAYDLPLSAFTYEPSPIPAGLPQNSFLHRAAEALLRPGTPLPADAVLACLRGDARPANVLRRMLFLQLSLLPYLRVHPGVTDIPGGFLLGPDLLVCIPDAEDRVDLQLPGGIWTELTGGECFSGRLRTLRSLNAVPLLARENAVITIGVDDRHTDHDDADRVTLHWFQPQGEAVCALADGTTYRLRMRGDEVEAASETEKAWHLVVHRDGEELFVR